MQEMKARANSTLLDGHDPLCFTRKKSDGDMMGIFLAAKTAVFFIASGILIGFIVAVFLACKDKRKEDNY